VREIKFRAKSIADNKWVYGYYLFDKGEYYIHLIDKCSVLRNYPVDIVNIHFETLGEYTELSDKNGKEIYEGDIYRDELGCINEVEFEDGTWSYAYDILEMCEEPSKEWEVLGNIYENPELMEE